LVAEAIRLGRRLRREIVEQELAVDTHAPADAPGRVDAHDHVVALRRVRVSRRRGAVEKRCTSVYGTTPIAYRSSSPSE
jgi:hypothetical protein